jgi:hypothetical protein
VGATQESRWWLGPDSLSASPVAPAGEVAFTFDPGDPTPHLGGNYIGDGCGAVDDLPLEARPDTAVFTSAPLEEQVTIAGEPSVDLMVAATSGHFDVFARLCVVDADGGSTNLSDAITTVARSEQSGRVSVRLTPVFATIGPGQRLRLVVAGGAHPRWLRHPGTDVSPVTATELSAVTQHIAVGTTDGSWLTLALLDSSLGTEQT